MVKSGANTPRGWSNGGGWPTLCLLENVTRHPSRPWLTAACTNHDGEAGAVLLFDWERGQLIYTHQHEESVGWLGSHDVLRWHPDGTRLGTTASTNGILVLEEGRPSGEALPDDGRDSGVSYVWVDDRLYTDTDMLIDPTRDEYATPPPPYPLVGGPEWNSVDGFSWNPRLRAAVADTLDHGIAAFSPETGSVHWRIAPSDRARTHISPDGRHVLRLTWQPGETSEVAWFDGDTGASIATHQSDLGVPSVSWGPAGQLALYTRTSSGPWLVELHDPNGRRARWHSEERITGSDLDLPAVSWSPDGTRLAVTVERGVVLLDAATAQLVGRLPVLLPEPTARSPEYDSSRGGSVWWVADDTLLRIEQHAVAVWSADGSRRSDFVMPTSGG